MLNELYETVLRRLKGVKKCKDGHIALCPAHEDTRQSLSIHAGKRVPVVLKCHYGCPYEEIMSALGLGRNERREIALRQQPAKTKPKKQEPAAPSRDWDDAWLSLFLATTGFDRLAVDLGVSQESLEAVGYCWLPYSDMHRGEACWASPERDAKGTAIGLLRRLPGAGKQACGGSKRGLSYSLSWRKYIDPWRVIFLVEGPSDVAAWLDLRLCAIGRPSNRGGVELLAELLADTPADIRIVVLGENDRKDSGQWPGREGACETARALAKRLKRPVGWCLPPEAVKDARRWRIEGVTAEQAVEWVKDHVCEDIPGAG